MFKNRKLLVIVGIALAGAILGGTCCLRIFSKSSVFEEVTGFQVPSATTIISDDFQSFGLAGMDGFRCILLRLENETSQSWLAAQPFYGKSRWKKGPITESWLRSPKSVPDSVTYSKDIFYSASSSKPGDGNLLILDPVSRQAWLLMWF